ncbi:MAG: MaoC family dehydratase [Pseudomonadota bacterium]
MHAQKSTQTGAQTDAQTDAQTRGRFFEDFIPGEVIRHATPRTVGREERVLATALYPNRFALDSADTFAAACGFRQSPVDPLTVFHVVFGKTVPDISLNAVANLGYAEGRFLAPVYPGDTLRAESAVIGRRQTGSGKAGIVWVRTTGLNQRGDAVLSYVRWVMVNKRDTASAAPEAVIPDLAQSVPAGEIVLPEGLDFTDYDAELAGGPRLWGDYAAGEKIDHVDGLVIEEAEHMMATRLWQNTARVHFDPAARGGQPRLVYGGHIISIARGLSFNGLENAQLIAAINAGTHVAPAFAGYTVYAWSEVLETAETAAPSVGALRLRLVATKNRPAADFPHRGEDGKHAPGVILDLDYWVLMPR